MDIKAKTDWVDLILVDMLEPDHTDLTIFLGRGWNHASTALRAAEGAVSDRSKSKFLVVGLPPHVDEKTMALTFRESQELFSSLSIQQPSDNLLDLIQKEKPSVVVDVSTQEKEKTESGTYVHADYNALTLLQEGGTMIQIPKPMIRSMRVVYANNKPVPQMLHALSVHLNLSRNATMAELLNKKARLDYFFNGVAAQVSHVFDVNRQLANVTVRSYLHLNMIEPSYKLDNVKIQLIEDYREKVDSSRQPAYEEEAYQTYAAAPPQASPSMTTRKQKRNVVSSKSNVYVKNKGDEQEDVQHSMQQMMDVTTDQTRVLLEKSRENVFALGVHELNSAKVVFRLEKSFYSFLEQAGFKEAMQPLDARISWTKAEESVALFSGAARFYAGGAPLSTDNVAFSPWKLGSEMTIDFPLSGFTFGRRLLHSTFDNQDGGRTKKVFRIDMYVSKHNTLKPRMLRFESLENIGGQAKEVNFIRRVTGVTVESLQEGLDKANRIDPYDYPTGAVMQSDERGMIEAYKNPDTGMYEPGVYKLESTAMVVSLDQLATMSHFFYEVIY